MAAARTTSCSTGTSAGSGRTCSRGPLPRSSVGAAHTGGCCRACRSSPRGDGPSATASTTWIATRPATGTPAGAGDVLAVVGPRSARVRRRVARVVPRPTVRERRRQPVRTPEPRRVSGPPARPVDIDEPLCEERRGSAAGIAGPARGVGEEHQHLVGSFRRRRRVGRRRRTARDGDGRRHVCAASAAAVLPPPRTTDHRRRVGRGAAAVGCGRGRATGADLPGHHRPRATARRSAAPARPRPCRRGGARGRRSTRFAAPWPPRRTPPWSTATSPSSCARPGGPANRWTCATPGWRSGRRTRSCARTAHLRWRPSAGRRKPRTRTTAHFRSRMSATRRPCTCISATPCRRSVTTAARRSRTARPWPARRLSRGRDQARGGGRSRTRRGGRRS